MAHPGYLAIDLGAESGRAVLGTIEGDRLQVKEIHRFPNGPVRVFDHLYWDALGLFREIKASIGKAVDAAGPDKIQSIGIDSWGVDFGLIGQGGTLVANPRHYRDPRTDGLMEKAFETVSRREIFERTGIQFMGFNTLYQLLAVKDQEPGLFEAAERLLMIGELFTYFLTGQAVAEFTNATTTQIYDPRKGAWSDELFRAFDLPRALMPDVVAPGTVVGPLLPSVSDDVGARGVRVVVPAVHDTGSAVAAVPAQGENWAFISSGTWSLVGMETPSPIIDEESLKYNFTNEGGVAGTYRFLKNVMGLWLLQECRRSWAEGGNALEYGEIAALAKEAPRFKALVDPDDPAFFRPDDAPAEIASYCKRTGQQPPSSLAQTARCVFESLALKYRYVVEGMERASGRKIDVIHVVGGGSRNELLNQMTADATGRPVLAGPAESTSLGNLMMQAVATGALADVTQGRALVRRSVSLKEYRPAETNAWDEAYERFLALLDG